MEEIKPIGSPSQKTKLLKLSVPFVGMAVLLGGMFFTVNNALQEEQDTRSSAATVGINYIKNPGCESNADGWTSWQSAHYRSTAAARTGSASCYVVRETGSSYTLDDSPDSVSYPKLGETYTASAWVRSTNSVGKPIRLALRQWSGSSDSTKFGTPVSLSTSWQRITNTVTIDRSDRTKLDIYIVQDSTVAGSSFYADDMQLYYGNSVPTSTPIPTKTPTPTPTPTRVPTVAPTATIIPTSVPTATTQPTPGLTLVPTATIAPTAVLPTATVAPTAIAATNTPAPSVTSVPGGTTVHTTLLLHGLGRGGDSVNAAALGNFTLQRPQRTITMEIFDVQNQLVLTKQGTVSFDTTAGNFVGTVDLGTQFATGLYTVKIKTDQYLRGLVAGIQTITVGQKTTLASLTLVNGDINNDNQINIVDYNIMVGCYSDLLPPISCDATKKVQADINDDGNVNQFDYNLFIRELTNLGGQ